MSGKSPRSCGTFKVNFPRSWPSGSGTTSTWIVLSRSSPEIGLPFSSTSFTFPRISHNGRIPLPMTSLMGLTSPNMSRNTTKYAANAACFDGQPGQWSTGGHLGIGKVTVDQNCRHQWQCDPDAEQDQEL